MLIQIFTFIIMIQLSIIIKELRDMRKMIRPN